MVNGDPWEAIARLNDEIKELRNEIAKLQKKVASLEAKVDMVLKNYSFTIFLIKWVVTPLIIILGTLAGVKMVIPNP